MGNRRVRRNFKYDDRRCSIIRLVVSSFDSTRYIRHKCQGLSGQLTKLTFNTNLKKIIGQQWFICSLSCVSDSRVIHLHLRELQTQIKTENDRHSITRFVNNLKSEMLIFPFKTEIYLWLSLMYFIIQTSSIVITDYLIQKVFVIDNNKNK